MDTEPRLQSYRGAGRHALYPCLLLLFFHPRRGILEYVCTKERDRTRGTERVVYTLPQHHRHDREEIRGECVFYHIVVGFLEDDLVVKGGKKGEKGHCIV